VLVVIPSWGIPMAEIAYSVPGLHCAHCERAVTDEVTAVAGVASVDVDLDTKLVTVRGDAFDDDAVRAAIGEAGYDVV
jgi:copper chaperone